MNTLVSIVQRSAIVCSVMGMMLFGQVALAQDTSDEDLPIEQQTVEAVPLVPEAGEDRNVIVNRTVLFDASGTTVPENAEVQYEWDFGDGSRASGVDPTHVFQQSGTYRVSLQVTATVDGQRQLSNDEIIVSVQDRLIVLVTDSSVTNKQIEALQEYALTQGALLVSVRNTGVDQEFLTLQNLAQQLLNDQSITSSDVIITWTAGNVGLNALVELGRIASFGESDTRQLNFQNKGIIAISESNVNSEKIALSVLQNLQPRFIALTSSDNIQSVIRAGDPESIQTRLATEAESQIITEYTARGLGQLGPLNFMSWALNFMINRGVPVNTIYLILMLPVMATLIAAARHLVGIKAFGIFAPTVIALSFLATGLKFGVTVFVAILVLGSIGRYIAKRIRMFYLPRMAMVLSFLALSILVMFFLGAYFNQTGFIAISIFPILIMTVITEHFVSVQVSQGFRSAVKLTMETLVLAVIGFFIGDWTVFKTTILAYPELILLTFVINFIVGRFSGLRLTEYVRFRNVFKYIRNAEGKR